MKNKVLDAATFVATQFDPAPKIGIVLGTGLGDLADTLVNSRHLLYSDIPHFPESTVHFHAGRLVCGEVSGKHMLIMQGRFHYYEGYSMQDITLPIRVMYQLGIRTLILSNAVGGIRERVRPGTLALITDHINLMGDSPLIGPYEEFLGLRFPDMSQPYSKSLRNLAHQVAHDLGITLIDTIYAAVSGPSFETPAEIRMLQILGADSVGMSVVPETLVARQLGMSILGISAITDQALPENMPPITHEQVSQTAKKITPDFNRLITELIKRITV
ncbi:purine-nucleoside phosphorylase [candidate division KSB1 bacterium]|nr:purine-nucleoside phosphorylase [candidate division KSB1 bacterium]RQW00339.1 MAG: purine-nucleoside phosphorylase [candidate division KSB1 bacterium]